MVVLGLNKWQRGRLLYERTNLRTQVQWATFLISNLPEKVVTRNIYLTMFTYRRSEKNRCAGEQRRRVQSDMYQFVVEKHLLLALPLPNIT